MVISTSLVDLIGHRCRAIKYLPDPADKHFGGSMVRLTRLNHVPLILNADLIEHIEETPDTVITLTTGQILRVRESADEVVQRIVEYRRRVHGPEATPERRREEPEASV